jgi:hypothetical protein
MNSLRNLFYILDANSFWLWIMLYQDYEIGICCFSAKHAALRRKSKDWLAQNQDNVSDWGDMSIHGLLLQWASTIKIQLIVLFIKESILYFGCQFILIMNNVVSNTIQPGKTNFYLESSDCIWWGLFQISIMNTIDIYDR